MTAYIIAFIITVIFCTVIFYCTNSTIQNLRLEYNERLESKNILLESNNTHYKNKLIEKDSIIASYQIVIQMHEDQEAELQEQVDDLHIRNRKLKAKLDHKKFVKNQDRPEPIDIYCDEYECTKPCAPFEIGMTYHLSLNFPNSKWQRMGLLLMTSKGMEYAVDPKCFKPVITKKSCVPN